MTHHSISSGTLPDDRDLVAPHFLPLLFKPNSSQTLPLLSRNPFTSSPSTSSPPRMHRLTPSPLSSPAPLPFVAASTKADQYSRRLWYDRRVLRRPQAHCRRALKTTEPLETVLRRLNRSLHSMELSSLHHHIPLERLSTYAAAFDEVIAINGVFSPLLQRIKDVYDSQIKYLLSKHGIAGLVPLKKGRSDRRKEEEEEERRKSLVPSRELFELKKAVHRLEVQSRVLLQENQRLRQELTHEEEVHRAEMAEIQAPVTEPEPERVESPQPKDYASRVEELQLQIAEHREATAETLARRDGRVPQSVCHQLEQCIREVEIKTQRKQKQNEKLKLQIQEAESDLLQLLQAGNTSQDSASLLWSHLQQEITCGSH